jgi:hypothetical protein
MMTGLLGAPYSTPPTRRPQARDLLGDRVLTPLLGVADILDDPAA